MRISVLWVTARQDLCCKLCPHVKNSDTTHSVVKGGTSNFSDGDENLIHFHAIVSYLKAASTLGGGIAAMPAPTGWSERSVIHPQ